MVSPGLRFWYVHNGTLVSPYRNVRLPVSGTLSAQCDTHPRPPALQCLCGVAYYATWDHMNAATDTLNLWDEPTLAITTGTISGRPIPDMPRTTAVGTSLSFRMVRTPPAWRCSTYTATTIYTDQPHDYLIPTHPLSELHEAMPGLRRT